jgi:hypothetical protein
MTAMMMSYSAQIRVPLQSQTNQEQMTFNILKSNGSYPKTWVLFLGFLSGLLAVAPAQGASFLQVIERENPRAFSVQAQDVALGEVLSEIANKTGILFKVPERFMNESVNLNIEERNWAEVVHRVLGDFNSIYIWNGPTRLGRVFLLDNNEGSEVSSLPLNTPSKQKINLAKAIHVIKKRYYQPNASGEKNEVFLQKHRMGLSEVQLKKVASGHLSSPLPEKLFEDRKIKKFLAQNGVKTIEDGKKPMLAVKVRRQALKLFKALKRSAMKNHS